MGTASFWAAVQFLTRLPIPGAGVRASDYGASLAYFPTVGIVLGALLAGADLALRQWFEPLTASALVVVLAAGLTGALHLDGLADTADATLAHASPERRLEIMRDPRVGTFGVTALVSVLVLKIVALAAVPVVLRSTVLLLVPLLGRWSIVLVAVTFPYGRLAGLGVDMKRAASPGVLALGAAQTALVCAWFGPFAVALFVLSGVVAWLLGRWLLGKLPGLTGDSYGATCELVELLTLLLAVPFARGLGGV